MSKPQPTYVIAKPCPFGDCKNVTELVVDVACYETWQRGELIQAAFPQMPVQDREFLLSGFCPTHMTMIFAMPEED